MRYHVFYKGLWIETTTTITKPDMSEVPDKAYLHIPEKNAWYRIQHLGNRVHFKTINIKYVPKRLRAYALILS